MRAQKESIAQCLLVFRFALQRLRPEGDRHHGVGSRVPVIVVDAVQNAAELALVRMQGVTKSEALIGEPRFPSMFG